MADNVLTKVINEVSVALLPLQQVTSKPKTVELFARLGYTLPETEAFKALPAGLISDVTGLVNGIVALANASSDSDRLDKALDLGIKIKDVAVEISGLVNALESAGADLANFVSKAQLEELPRRLLDYLIATYLKNFYSGPYSFMLLLGMTDEIDLPADAGKVQPAFTLHKIWWERLPKYFSNPRGLINEIYNWETDFNSNLFLERLERILRGFMLPGGIYNQSTGVRGGLGNADAGTKEIRIPILQAGNSPELYSQFGLLISPAAADGPKKKGLALMPYFTGVSNMAFNLNESYEIKLNASAGMDDGLGIILRPPLNLEVIDKLFTAPASTGNFNLKLTLKKKASAQGETILFGSADGSRVSVKGVEFAAFVSKQGDKNDFGFEFGVTEARIVISSANADGFLQKILSGLEVNTVFSVGFGYSANNGVYFTGSGGLEIVLPTHITIGPVSIESALIGLRFKDDVIPIDLAASIKGELGPIVIVVQNMGVTTELSFPPDGKGNVGPMNLTPKFKPPNGIGLSIDAGVVKGGGFILFDPDKGQYAGALELSIADMIQVAAICVITTKMPDGSEGFSLLIIIGVTFSPGISLSMGFFLSGLGGILGINRTINVDAMRDGVKSGAIDNILFPTDIVNNITTIISQVTQIFPPKKDQFIIGLMARITWGVPALVTIDFGLAVEFASPVRIAILGVLKIVLPTEEAAVLQLQINFLGIIDFEKGMLSFDASLYNSRILTFTLEGDMALRLGWGQTKGFLLSVGGFHPSFRPPAELKVPNMSRLTLNILTGNPRLVLTCYFAVTSNTVQFGARLDLRFSVSDFSVVGYMYLDVLFQFSPFHFIANIGAGLEVKMGSTTLFSIQLDFELSGPTPWHAKGTASFSILFFTIKVRFDEEWGEKNSIQEPSIAVLPKVLEAFNLDANWSTELPPNRSALVALKEIKVKPGEVVLQSFGSFKISQTIVPLVQVLEKFGNAKPSDIKKIEVAGIKIGSLPLGPSYITEAFAPAMFKNLGDADKLSAPSFEQMKSGIKVIETNNIVVNSKANRKVEYEEKVSDFDPTPSTRLVSMEKDLMRRMAKGGAVGKSALSKEQAYRSIRQKEGTVGVDDESFVIVNKATRSKVSAEKFTKGVYSEALDAMKKLQSENPLAEIQVIPAYHFEMA